MRTHRRSRPAGARHRSLAAFAALAGLAMSAAPLGAQQPGDTVSIDSLVVTGSRVAIPRTAVSTGLTVLSGGELRARGVTHLLDALRTVPGMSVAQTGSFGGTTSLFLRGGESDYVKVLVDGVPLNEPGGRADLANLTLDNVERIEVVRGPASVLYGSDAVAGVVQVFTRQGRGAPRLRAGVRGGTYGSLAYDAEVSGASGSTGYALSASRFTTDGAYAYNNEYRNGTLSGLVRLRPDERTDATFTLRYADSRFHFPTDGAGALVDRNAFQLEERVALGVEIGRFFTERLEGRLHLTASGIDGGTDDRPDDAADTLGTYAYRSQDHLRRRGLDARTNLHLSPTAILTAGVALEEQRQRSSNEYRSEWGPGSGSFEAERSTRGYYLQALADLFGRLSLNLGARVDDNEAFGTFATYRAGAAYRLPATGTRLRASAGTAFKEPNIMEHYGAGFVTGNPALEPERSRSWEIGLEQSLLGGRLFLAGAYFDQRFRDLIQYLGQPFGSTDPNYFNVAEAAAAGIELEARLEPVRGLVVAGSYTRLDSEATDAGFQSGPDAEFVEGRRLLRRPDHAGSVSVAWRVGESGSLQAAAHYVGERDDLDFAGWPAARVALPAYTRLDLGGEVRLLAAGERRPDLTLTARVDNLLDERYAEIVNFPARGRTIFVGARLGLGI